MIANAADDPAAKAVLAPAIKTSGRYQRASCYQEDRRCTYSPAQHRVVPTHDIR